MLRILDTISDPGHPEKPNEDAFGHSEALAWVIDGATGVADSELLDAPTDAHWLAQTASRLFADHGARHGADLHGLTRAAIEEIARRFDAGRSRAPNGRYELPSAAMTLVHSDGATLRCANFADCRLILVGDDGETAISGDHHTDREAASRKRTAELVSAVVPGADTRSSADVMRYLRAARNRQNTESGYWILGLDPRAVEFMRSWEVALTRPVTGLLMTDGFASLAYDYDRLAPAGLVVEARENGLSSVVEKISKIEREEDPHMRIYPRFKRSDDATAVLFRAAPKGL
jgi:serine/threonine protein phosphatase PrpC